MRLKRILHWSERILPEASVQRMIALAGSRRDQMLLRVLYASGVRVSELCGASWRNCQQNGESGQITVVGKGSKIRSIVLPVGLWKDLIDFRGQTDDEKRCSLPEKVGAISTSHRFFARLRKRPESRPWCPHTGCAMLMPAMRWIVVRH
jgi:site-specific recombinase XerC